MKRKLMVAVLGAGLIISGCGMGAANGEQVQAEASKEKSHVNQTTGDRKNQILASTNWQGTKVYDKNGKDLTKENQELMSFAKYDKKNGRYEFFDQKTGESRGDSGTYFITNDGTKRILISETKNYQAVVDITKLTKQKFTYKRMGKDEMGNPVEVYVDHIPYHEQKLSFTKPLEKLSAQTGKIVRNESGAKLLGETLWNGTKVVDADGKDVTKYNQNFISLAKFDAETNKYEFFDLNTGVTRGDFGYFDVLRHNKIRAHASIGTNKYGAVLEITELNNERFTYKREGKNAAGETVSVFVEHEPYQGEFNPAFTF
ncbi:DUF4822 domain-containing protein [Listeria kieliensis]